MPESKINTLDDIDNLIYTLREYEKNKVPIALVSLIRTLDMYAHFIKAENAYVKAEITIENNKPIIKNHINLKRPSRLSQYEIDNMFVLAYVNIKDDSIFNCLRIQLLVLHKNEGEMINLIEDDVIIKDVNKTHKK